MYNIIRKIQKIRLENSHDLTTATPNRIRMEKIS